MKVKELIRQLQMLDDNLEVVTNNNSEYSRIYAIEYEPMEGDVFVELATEYFEPAEYENV